MEKFGIDQRKVVSEAFNSIVEAFEKDIKNKTEETKIDITFREDNSIFILMEIFAMPSISLLF